MILMGDKFTVRFLVSGLPVERVKFGFLKDYAIRGKVKMPSSHLINFPESAWASTQHAPVLELYN